MALKLCQFMEFDYLKQYYAQNNKYRILPDLTYTDMLLAEHHIIF